MRYPEEDFLPVIFKVDLLLVSEVASIEGFVNWHTHSAETLDVCCW